MKTSLAAEVAASVGERLRQTNAAHTRRYPGESGRRQPVHTVYGGAHLFKADSAQRLGELARRALERYAPDREAGAGAGGRFSHRLRGRLRHAAR